MPYEYIIFMRHWVRPRRVGDCSENKLAAPMLGCRPFGQFYIIAKVLQPFYMVATYSVS
jgi:hypothetical protein